MNNAIKGPQTGDHILLIYTVLYLTILYYIYYLLLEIPNHSVYALQEQIILQ